MQYTKDLNSGNVGSGDRKESKKKTLRTKFNRIFKIFKINTFSLSHVESHLDNQIYMGGKAFIF